VSTAGAPGRESRPQAIAGAVHRALVYDDGDLDVGAGAAAGAAAAVAAAGAGTPEPTVRSGAGPATGTGSRAVLAELVRRHDPAVDAVSVDGTVDRVLARMSGLGPLQPLLADRGVTDVMVNGPGPVWIERAGRLEVTDVDLDRPTIEHLVERIVGPLGLRADRSSPMVDARLADGSRAHVVMPPIAVDGPIVTIRRFAARPVALDAMAHPSVAALLTWAVTARLNLIVTGGTGAGKTTLLNSLAAAIPSTERIVTVEEAAELRLAHHHVVRLEARPAGPDAGSAITIRQLVRNALRMRPDRIIVGECRGAEALEVLVAANSGHEGSLSTCHANSPVDALRRLETMVLLADTALPLDAVRDQVGAAVDLVVQVARRADGCRRVVAVAEVVPPGAVASPPMGRHGRHWAPTCRVLGDEHALRALPERPARSDEVGPADPRWVTPAAMREAAR
jgi:pilus assembly protein CpaF